MPMPIELTLARLVCQLDMGMKERSTRLLQPVFLAGGQPDVRGALRCRNRSENLLCNYWTTGSRIVV
uniref:Uncharacterized protein n=1 Tax=Setaria italica TaxID=4555 RepID=K4AP41_SETIT